MVNDTEVNEYIDAHGGIAAAADAARATIARRAADGKPSPRAEAMLAEILRRGVEGYETPRQQESRANWVASGGFDVG